MQLVSRKPAETPPPRMRPLATLPVFFDLAGKRAIVAGGSARAAWKVDLLLAAGAHVDVYAPTLAPEMTTCLAAASADDAV
ncbi:MAG TPA: NAD(P)-dependent oxidoreductase, partial [Vineibacter sp.]|nr:NAD(P)-dependent oxidoreductase [Vineibacter sp.]